MVAHAVHDRIGKHKNIHSSGFAVNVLGPGTADGQTVLGDLCAYSGRGECPSTVQRGEHPVLTLLRYRTHSVGQCYCTWRSATTRLSDQPTACPITASNLRSIWNHIWHFPVVNRRTNDVGDGEPRSDVVARLCKALSSCLCSLSHKHSCD